ncbi:MAG TPA: hypothetical protein PKN09_12930, partial [Novosphingobium sp.]|nr:hypothetical protein [Novosphingobium sp.]
GNIMVRTAKSAPYLGNVGRKGPRWFPHSRAINMQARAYARNVVVSGQSASHTSHEKSRNYRIRTPLKASQY